MNEAIEWSGNNNTSEAPSGSAVSSSTHSSSLLPPKRDEELEWSWRRVCFSAAINLLIAVGYGRRPSSAAELHSKKFNHFFSFHQLCLFFFLSRERRALRQFLSIWLNLFEKKAWMVWLELVGWALHSITRNPQPIHLWMEWRGKPPTIQPNEKKNNFPFLFDWLN